MEVKVGMRFFNTYGDKCCILGVKERRYLEGWNIKEGFYFTMGTDYFMNNIEKGLYKIIEDTSWYPDDSGEWAEVPEYLTEMPKELHPEDAIEVLHLEERESKEYVHYVYDASGWNWNSDSGARRIVAYKIVKKYQEHSEEPSNEQSTEWTNKHYNFSYKLTDNDIESGSIKIDPYFVAKIWGLGKKDETGVLFHNLKTIARFGDKNSVEREIKALHRQIVRLAELNNVKL